MRDRSLDPVRASLLSIPILVGLVVLVSVPHWWLWLESPLKVLLGTTDFWSFLLVFFSGIIVHEVIHGFVWTAAGRLQPDDVSFGIDLRTFSPYAHPTVPLSARVYRIGAAMPAIILGVLPAVTGIVTGNSTLSAWGAVFLSVACGDLLMLIMLRDVPGDTIVQDHPTRIGCEIIDGVPQPS